VAFEAEDSVDVEDVEERRDVGVFVALEGDAADAM